MNNKFKPNRSSVNAYPFISLKDAKIIQRSFMHSKKLKLYLVHLLNRLGIYPDNDFREWNRLCNLYWGKSGFVIGNGPSLRIEDLDQLIDQITIASNRIYLAYDKTEFRPTMLTSIDAILAENSVEELRALQGKKYFADSLRDTLEPMPDAIYWKAESGAIGNSMRRKFSPDARNCIYAGHTITYNNLQIAYHLGLRTVYLIGMDFSFTLPVRRKNHEYAQALISEGEVNHFLPNYRKPGELWSMPDLKRQEAALISAKEYYESHGRRVLNATRGGKLEVFPRVDLDKVLKSLNKQNT